MGRDEEGGKKEMKGWEEKRFAGPMSNCFLRPCNKVLVMGITRLFASSYHRSGSRILQGRVSNPSESGTGGRTSRGGLGRGLF